MANQIKKKFLGNDQVDGSKILLDNAQFVRVKKADGSVKDLFRLGADDKFYMSDAPIITTESSDPKALQTKGQVAVDIAVESAARVAADGVLQGNINTVAADVTLVEQNLASEVSARVLQGNQLQTNITAEANARIAADGVLDGKILTEKQRSEAAELVLRDGLAQELLDRAAQDGILDGKITSAVSTLNSSIASETSARVAGDAATLTSAKAYTDQKVSDLLGGIPDTTLDTIKEIADAIKSDQTATGAILTRLTNDESRLTALEQVQAPIWVKQKFQLTAPMISAGYVDLAHLAVGASLDVMVDRLCIHESDDYTISPVGGKTRITFVNGLVSPGNESLDVGDNVFVRYQY